MIFIKLLQSLYAIGLSWLFLYQRPSPLLIAAKISATLVNIAEKNNQTLDELDFLTIKKIANNLRIWRNKQTLSVKHNPKK